MGIGTDDPMQDILDSAIEWQLRGGHPQQQRKAQASLMQQASHSHQVTHTHALPIPALDCNQQGVGLSNGGFQ